MSIKKLYELAILFVQERAADNLSDKGFVNTKNDMDLIKELLDFIMRHRRDEYIAKKRPFYGKSWADLDAPRQKRDNIKLNKEVDKIADKLLADRIKGGTSVHYAKRR